MKEITSIRGPENSEHDIADATAELNAIVESTETATSDILGAAEQIQEFAWTLREQGAPSEFCDAPDERVTDIYTACSFQDITGQRTTRVVQVLQSLETASMPWPDCGPVIRPRRTPKPPTTQA